MKKLSYFPLSESAILIDFGTTIDPDKNNQILQLANHVTNHPFPGFIEAVPAYTTLTVYYDITQASHYSYEEICNYIEALLPQVNQQNGNTNKIRIPVCYDQAFGLDLHVVASTNQLSPQEVIQLHTNTNYHVYFLGFSPGFPFLGGMSPKIATPRKNTPRLSVPAGSVGIAGKQTGIYPTESPGGWQIIGRTPLSLLQLNQKVPTRIQPGDTIRFEQISKEAFYALETEGKSWD